MSEMIFNKEDYKALKKLYDKSTDEILIFKGKEILRGYAKYMLEYLALMFDKK
jgi:hypothetical protein